MQYSITFCSQSEQACDDCKTAEDVRRDVCLKCGCLRSERFFLAIFEPITSLRYDNGQNDGPPPWQKAFRLEMQFIDGP